jgi:hypothetical protein
VHRVNVITIRCNWRYNGLVFRTIGTMVDTLNVVN